MSTTEGTEGRIQKVFDEAWKEYAAHERTLDALAALSFILANVREIHDETLAHDFRPRITPHSSDAEPYTPDGLIWQKPPYSFLLELKASWNLTDVAQIIKYAKSPGYQKGNTSQPFADNHCVLLGYQNTPGDADLDKLFDEWQKESFPFPLVVFHYGLEVAAGGHRILFSRIAYARNGVCPASSLGKAMNAARGVTVSVERAKFERSRFHKANDQALPSYAAVLWWTTYANHYLTEEQKIEMAASGRLSTPLIIPPDRLNEVPDIGGVDVPLTSKDIRRALEFLSQTGLVILKKRKKQFEVKLKDDRHIRFPLGTLAAGFTNHQDTATKIIARWAAHKVKHPAPERRVAKRPRKAPGRRARDTRTLPLFPGSS
jgi:hypothetical protein